MKADTERYNICLHCIDEQRYTLVVNIHRDHAVTMIKIKIGLDWHWSNYWQLDNGWPTYKVCNGCPYIVEHVAFAHDDVHEHSSENVI